MPVTVLLDPAEMPARTQEQETFDQKMAAVMQKLPILGQQINATEAGMNTVAAGGAYAIPYTFNLQTIYQGGANGGILSFYQGGSGGPPGGASTATAVYVDMQVNGKYLTSLIASMLASSSAIKGQIRVEKFGDPSHWANFNVTGYVQGSGDYGYFTVIPVDQSSAIPFGTGDGVVLKFQRTGDKGDTVSDTPTMIICEQQAAGVNSATNLVAGSWVKRLFNTVVANTIPNAVLSGGVVGLPTGTYEMEGDAAGIQCGAHKVRFINTNESIATYGTPELAPTGSAISTRSFVTARFTISAARNFELQHIVASSAVGGTAANLGGAVENYSRVTIKKVA